MARKRHLSRIAVMQTLFEREARVIKSDDVLDRNIKNLTKEFGEVDIAFSHSILEGALAHESAIKVAVETYAPEWPLERMDPIARSILLVGAAEILYHKDAPHPVIINECIDMAKEFGGAETSKFVNGVLHSLAKNAV